MWILSKHPSTEGSDCNQFFLLAGRKYIIGRKDCDIIIPGDISISRRHAIIVVSNVNPADSELPVEGIAITDTSKVGVLLNGKKIPSNEATAVKDGDLISFGRLHLKYKLIHQRLVVVTSCINSSTSKASVKSCVQKLGGYLIQNWSDKATHLVMEKVTFTMKVVCALACGKPVVSVKYLEDLLDCCDKKTCMNLPREKNYLPSISEQSLIQHELLFHPNSIRSSLLVGKIFVVLVPPQFKRIKDTIQFAGGAAVLKDTKDGKFMKQLSSSQTIVMQVEKKDEKNSTEEQMIWMKEVYRKLTQHNLRAIRESEVGLAILHASLDQYCNPTLKSAPALSGSTHTQVIADSMCATQMTQLPECVDATQVLENIAGPQPDDPITISTKENVVKSTKNFSTNSLTTAKFDPPNSTPGRKRPIRSQDDNKGQKNLEQFFKKPKLTDENTISCRIDDNEDDVLDLLTSNTMNQTRKEDGNKKIIDKDFSSGLKSRKAEKIDKSENSKQDNIINIDDDDDEDDVFSFNYSRPTLSVKMDDDCIDTVMKTSEAQETRPVSPEKIADTTQSIAQTNAHSDVLFTTLSKHRVPDSCQSSLISQSSKIAKPDTCLPSALTPLIKKPSVDVSSETISVPESCPTFQRNVSTKSVLNTHASSVNTSRKLYDFNDDGDDDDDPFSFSVDVSTSTKSKIRDADKNNDNQKNRLKSNILESDKLVSDSDTSMNKTLSDDEKQQSRFLKAISSSQDSEVENVYLSDDAGKLISSEKKSKNVEQKETEYVPESITETSSKKNDVDLSYLIDDEDIVSKEYSLQKQRNSIPLDGFISTLDMHQKFPIIKEEDPDLIGVDTDLIQTTFVSLVVQKPVTKKAPRKTCDVPGSKLKNFKCFKKQYYAGRSKKNTVIGKRDLVVYASDNVERASLFADIREKDEEEAAENRRIDKMFDVMTRKR